MNCGSCGREPAHGTIMIGMAAGRDGNPWALCWRCWRPAPAVTHREVRATAKRAAATSAPGTLL